MSQNIGTTIGAAIRVNDSLDPIASAWSNEIKGGHHSYEIIDDRNNLILARRQWGMLCTITSGGVSTTYELTKGLVNTDIMDNSNWEVFNGTSFTSPLNTKGDLLGFSTTQIRIPAAANGNILVYDSTQASGFRQDTISGILGFTPVNKAGDTLTGALLYNSSPVGPYELVNKNYVDSIAAGIKPKNAVAYTTTGNITLSGLGTQAGGEWTAALTAGDEILVKSQTTPAQNGIYVAGASGWVRRSDIDTWAEVPGSYAFVLYGPSAGTGYVSTSSPSGTIDTTPIIFTQFNQAADYTADGNGITKIGNQFSLVLDGATLSKSSSGLKVANLGVGTAQLAVSGVTYEKIQNVASPSKFLGRGDSGAGIVQELSISTGAYMVGTNIHFVGTGIQNLEVNDLNPLFTTSIANTGTGDGLDAFTLDQSILAGGIFPVLSFSLNNQNANLVFAGPASGSATAPSFRSLVTADLSNGIITYAKIQNVSAQNKILGRYSTGAGAVEELSFGAGFNITSGVININGVSPLTTKGDIWTRNATAEVRLGVGAAGTFLTPDPTTSIGLTYKTLSGIIGYVPEPTITPGTNGQIYATVGSAKAWIDPPVDTSIRQTVVVSNSFAAGDIVKYNAGSYSKAQANTFANAKSVGIIESASGTQFTIVYRGIITLSGLTTDALYYLSSSTAGLLTTTEPSTIGEVSKPMLIAKSATIGMVLNDRSIAIVPTLPDLLTSPLSAKGDLWGWSTTNARLGVGANGTFLTPDSTAPLGLAYKTISNIIGYVPQQQLPNPSSNGQVLAKDTDGTVYFVSLPVVNISSVFGRTGAIVAVSGDYNSSQITENTNLYFTTARARNSVSGTAPIDYNPSTGIISIQVASGSQAGYLSAADWTTFNNKANPLSYTPVESVTGTTDRITVSAGFNPVVNISSNYAGQTSIVTVGTLTAGTLGTGFTPVADARIASASTWNGKEPGLGTPLSNGQFLVSTTANVRSWISLTPSLISWSGSNTQQILGDGTLVDRITNTNQLANGANYLTETTANAFYAQLDGSYSNPAWITSLAGAKVTGLGAVAYTNDYNDLINKPSAGVDAYSKTEINSFFSGSVGITGYSKGLWDTAYGWGNHALAGYLTSFSESDPVFIAFTNTSRSQNTFYAGPSGSAGAATFRLITSADIPNLAASKITGLATVATTGSYNDLSNKPSFSSYLTGLSIATANGFSGSVGSGTTPALTIGTSVTGLLKGNGGSVSAAVAGTDYQIPISFTTTGSGAATFVGGALNIPTPSIVSPPFADNAAHIKNNTVNSKQITFSAAAITAGNTRVLTAQDNSYTIAGTDIANTFVVDQRFTNRIQIQDSTTTNIMSMQYGFGDLRISIGAINYGFSGDVNKVSYLGGFAGFQMPGGTTAQRPSGGLAPAGTIRFNTTLNDFDFHNSTFNNWINYVPTTRTITINGVAQSLASNVNFYIEPGIGGSVTSVGYNYPSATAIALDVTDPSTSPVIVLTYTGDSTQYIKGDGTLGTYSAGGSAATGPNYSIQLSNGAGGLQDAKTQAGTDFFFNYTSGIFQVNATTNIGTTGGNARLNIIGSSGLAPIQIVGNTLLTIPINGSIEYNGTHFYGTVGGVRAQLDNQNDTLTGMQVATALGYIPLDYAITGVGTFSNISTAKGLSVVGTNIILHAASEGNAGAVSAGSQIFWGDKHIGQAGSTPPTSDATVKSSYKLYFDSTDWNVYSVAEPINWSIQAVTYASATPALVFQSNGLDRMSIDTSGRLKLNTVQANGVITDNLSGPITGLNIGSGSTAIFIPYSVSTNDRLSVSPGNGYISLSAVGSSSDISIYYQSSGTGVHSFNNSMIISGGLQVKRRTITASTTLLSTDSLVLVDTTAGAVTLTLPYASANDGRLLRILKVNSGANAVIIAAQSFDGSVLGQAANITAQYASRLLVSDGTKWYGI